MLTRLIIEFNLDGVEGLEKEYSSTDGSGPLDTNKQKDEASPIPQIPQIICKKLTQNGP
jgi:hypothetical protein